MKYSRNEITDEPLDITDKFGDLTLILKQKKIKIFQANLEYLLENTSKLQEEKTKNHYLIISSYSYYSPSNFTYDFTQEIPKIDIGDEDLPALIVTSDSNHIPFYIHEKLVMEKPEIVSKGYSKNKKIEPIGLQSPLFAINTHPNSKLLVPYVLMDFEGVFNLENIELYSKYTQ